MPAKRSTERNFESIPDATLSLLGETIRLVKSIGQDFVVVGGWSPLLLNDSPLPHPGTRDVDLLFRDGASKGELQEVVETLRRNGFLSSAKHAFQVLRVLTVRSEPMVFGVDLLHPLDLPDSELNADLFVDHVQLPIPANRYLSDLFTAQSIAAPHAGFIFDSEHYVRVERTIGLPSGHSDDVSVPVVDEVGLIVTKTHSMHSEKRPRDVFDVYVAIAQARNYDKLISAFKDLERSHTDAFNTLFGLRKYLDKNSDVGRRIELYIEERSRDPALTQGIDPYARTIRQFLTDVGLGDEALPRYRDRSPRSHPA